MTFKEKWLCQIIEKILLVYPNDSKKKITKFAESIYERDFKDHECILYNNYEKEEIRTTISKLYDWILTKKPILTESGTMFKHHDECWNPQIEILNDKLMERDREKSKMFDFQRLAEKSTDPNEIDMYLFKAKKKDLSQSRAKVISNSEYGASGLPSSWFFNIAVSSATTARGQALISTACNAFEDFLGDNVKFMNMDECLLFINNIVKEKDIRKKDDSKWVKNKNINDVFDRLKSKFFDQSMCEDKILNKILRNLNQENLNRIYYKSNFYNFILNSEKAIEIFLSIFTSNVDFTTPNDAPSEIVDKLNKLTSAFLEYVHYNYPTINRTLRLKTMKRNCVVVVDTDSCFLNYGQVYDFFINEILNKKKIIKRRIKSDNGKKYVIESRENLKAKSESKNRGISYRIINSVMYITNSVIKNTLDVFLDRCNCDRDHGNTSMKNEFLYDTLLICPPAKKHYQGAIRLREGVEYKKPKFDIKGMDYVKRSAAGDSTREFIKNLVYDDILMAKNNSPDFYHILKKLNKFEKDIEQSVIRGEDKYIKNVNVKSEDAYDDPMSIGPYKAVFVWNYLYPNMKIDLPGSAKIIKVNLTKLKDFSKLSIDNPSIYGKLKKLFESNDRIMKSGITSIALPIDESVPDWMVPYINLDEIVSNNTDLLLPILNNLGMKAVYKTKSSQFYSNIINI